MSDLPELNELYQEVILDHYRTPRNFGTLADANRTARGDNPLCGDKIALFVKMRGDVIEDLRFKGAGCAISTASASLMSESVKGMSRKDAKAMFEKFHAMVTGEGGAGGSTPLTASLGKLDAFSGVSEFPVRVKCATLAWHTLRAAIEGRQDTVSTE